MGLNFGTYELLTRFRSALVGPVARTASAPPFTGHAARKCLMFGRAKMSLSAEQIDWVSQRDGYSPESLTGWADTFLQQYGFQHVQSLDYDAFEGARLQWNLNQPLLDEDCRGLGDCASSFDLVLDYGTSEHVFNPAMSFYNASVLLKENGVLNTVLPVSGFGDHGFFQFNPSFFYAVDRPEFKLVSLVFFAQDPTTTKLMLWDGLSESYRDHVHGAFDGSYAANCLHFLDRPILAWALFKKTVPMDRLDFMQNTQQLVYKRKWEGAKAGLDLTSDKRLEIYRLPSPSRENALAEYARSISVQIEQLLPQNHIA